MKLKSIYNLAENKLFKINRSITGKGIIKTLKIIKSQYKDLKIKKIRSGSKTFDWKIPPEWIVTQAYVIDKNNKKIIDFKKNNLHLVGFSKFINRKVKKAELLSHLHSLPTKPKAIPYVTSYYRKNWGFCVSEIQKNNLKKIIIKMIILKFLLIQNLKKMAS